MESAVIAETVTFSGPQACRLAGVTYRQCDYWARTGVLVPTVEARGSGSARCYTYADVVGLAIVKAFSGGGMQGRGSRPPTGAAEAARAGATLVGVRAGVHRPEVVALDDWDDLREYVTSDPSIGVTVVDAAAVRELVDMRIERGVASAA